MPKTESERESESRESDGGREEKDGQMKLHLQVC